MNSHVRGYRSQMAASKTLWRYHVRRDMKGVSHLKLRRRRAIPAAQRTRCQRSSCILSIGMHMRTATMRSSCARVHDRRDSIGGVPSREAKEEACASMKVKHRPFLVVSLNCRPHKSKQHRLPLGACACRSQARPRSWAARASCPAPPLTASPRTVKGHTRSGASASSFNKAC